MESDNNYGYYHVYNRGVDKRDIFMDDYDRVRMISDIQAFCYDDDQQLVDILCFCLMDNHYHLLIEQKEEFGLSKFMQKLGIGYTIYFNNRYRRSGVLFESGYKSKEITDDGYLWHMYRYIHLNPLKLLNKKWKRGLSNVGDAMNFVYKYPWSSLKDTFSDKNMVVNNKLIKSEFENTSDYMKFLIEWILNGVPYNFSLK